jgi:hypothetical protein
MSISLQKTDPWVAQQRTALVEERASVASSKPDLTGDAWAKIGGALVLGAGVGALGLWAGGKLSNDMQLGKSLLTFFGGGAVGFLAGGVGGGLAGSYLTRPRGAAADAIRGAHQVDVDNRLRIIDAQLQAFDGAVADTPHI